MPGHDEFEIAIEQRRHGGLDPEASARLDEHLAAECGAFAALTNNTEDEMKQQAAAAIARVDWCRIERGIAGWKAEIRRRHWRGLRDTIITAPTLYLLFGAEAIGPIIGVMIGQGIVRLRHQGTLAEGRLAEKAHASLQEFYRRQLDREIVAHRRTVVLSGLVAPVLVVSTFMRSHAAIMVAASIAWAIAIAGQAPGSHW